MFLIKKNYMTAQRLTTNMIAFIVAWPTVNVVFLSVARHEGVKPTSAGVAGEAVAVKIAGSGNHPLRRKHLQTIELHGEVAVKIAGTDNHLLRSKHRQTIEFYGVVFLKKLSPHLLG